MRDDERREVERRRRKKKVNRLAMDKKRTKRSTATADDFFVGVDSMSMNGDEWVRFCNVRRQREKVGPVSEGE